MKALLRDLRGDRERLAYKTYDCGFGIAGGIGGPDALVVPFVTIALDRRCAVDSFFSILSIAVVHAESGKRSIHFTCGYAGGAALMFLIRGVTYCRSNLCWNV